MTKEQSLGDQHTQAGKMDSAREGAATRSLGDSQTLVGGLADDSIKLEQFGELTDLSVRYTLESTLGQGGMGEVLLATDNRLMRRVAIKRVRGELARSKSALSRFLTEAQAIASLSHNNIVQVYDYGRDQSGPFMVLEYVDGGSLLEKCRGGKIEWEEAVDLTCQLCDGLAAAHEAGILHRDIKPANILVTKSKVAKLTDFGLAKAEAADSGVTMAGAVLGTLDFMPPEQRADVSLTDARSDLWSLAATLYQMVTGETPRVIDLDAVPIQLRSVLAQALKTRKEDRFQTANELKDNLKRCLQAGKLHCEAAAAELSAGECPACHVRNEASRKFCRECGGSLRTACPKCGSEIPHWDKVCPECGARQAELLEAGRLEFIELQKQAEKLRTQHQYDEALSTARVIAECRDRRFSEFGPWATQFITLVEVQRLRAEEAAAKLVHEAKMHREAGDLAAARQSVRRIPIALKSLEAKVLEEQLASEQEELDDLLPGIRTAVKQKQIDGLLPAVERAVQLGSNREDLKKLLVQLRDREERLRDSKKAQDEASDAINPVLLILERWKQKRAPIEKTEPVEVAPVPDTQVVMPDPIPALEGISQQKNVVVEQWELINPRRSSSLSTGDKIAAIALALAFGVVGAHNFFLGHKRVGLSQLGLTVFTCGYGGVATYIWALVDVVRILNGTLRAADA